jgi:hypothetical protein
MVERSSERKLWIVIVEKTLASYFVNGKLESVESKKASIYSQGERDIRHHAMILFKYVYCRARQSFSYLPPARYEKSCLAQIVLGLSKGVSNMETNTTIFWTIDEYPIPDSLIDALVHTLGHEQFEIVTLKERMLAILIDKYGFGEILEMMELDAESIYLDHDPIYNAPDGHLCAEHQQDWAKVMHYIKKAIDAIPPKMSVPKHIRTEIFCEVWNTFKDNRLAAMEKIREFTKRCKTDRDWEVVNDMLTIFIATDYEIEEDLDRLKMKYFG